MTIFHDFSKDTSGAISSQWVVLTAAVVAMAIAAVTIVTGGVSTTSNTTSNQVASISTNSSANFEAIRIPEKIAVTPTKTSVRAPLSSPFIAWMDIPDAKQCENAYYEHDSVLGESTQICPQTSEVLQTLRTDQFVISQPRSMHVAVCDNPANKYYHLVDSPLEVCLQSAGAIAMAIPMRPDEIQVAAITNFQRMDPCDTNNKPRYRQPGMAVQGCKITNNMIATLSLSTQALHPRFVKAPAFTEPEQCLKSDCQFARKSEAQPQHSYFSAAPSLLTPIRCGTPPCVFSRPADTPLAPSMMSLSGPEPVFTR